jgi:hypothetical protein
MKSIISSPIAHPTGSADRFIMAVSFPIGEGCLSECALVLLSTGPAVRKNAKLAGQRRHSWGNWLVTRVLSREAKILRVLKDIPGVPDLIHFGASASLFRTYVPGNAATWGWVPHPAQIAALASVVNAIHSRGVSMLDLGNPSNIILLPGATVGLIDFNTAVKASSPVSRVIYRIGVIEDQYHIEKYRRCATDCRPVARPATSLRRYCRLLRHLLLHCLYPICGFRAVTLCAR